MHDTRPRKAMVLAAGYGTRMRPLTLETPKPLLPLWGRPLLEHNLHLLQSWGVREVLINLHHGAEAILRWTLLHTPPGLRVSFSFEPDILGTGGALARAAWFFDETPFWLINADIAADLDPQPLLQALRGQKAMAAVWLDEHRGPRTVERMNGDLRTFRSATPGQPGTCTFCGLHLLSRRVLKYLSPQGFSSIIQGYEKALLNGERVVGVCVENTFWADLGTPEQYLEAHRQVFDASQHNGPGARLLDPRQLKKMRDARRQGVQIEGFAAFGENVQLQPGAQLKNAILFDGAFIGARAHLQECIVGTGTQINGRASGVVMRTTAALTPEEQRFLRFAHRSPEHTAIQPLGARGSARVFQRVLYGAKSQLLVHYTPEREENALYAGHTHFLASIGLRVPALLAHDPARRLSLFEDLGTCDLKTLLASASAQRKQQVYERVLSAVLHLHQKGTLEARRQRIPLMPPFTKTLYQWEHEYFIEHMLHRRLNAPAPLVRQVRRDLEQASSRLLKAPRVLLHRDLQSSNIFWITSSPALIDYQGMRYGPAVYDVASLLCDPYVEWPEALQEKLLQYYARHTHRPEAVTHLFWWAAVQRLAQALGAYARLSTQPGMADFARHIVPATSLMARALSHLPPLPGLQDAVDKIQNTP